MKCKSRVFSPILCCVAAAVTISWVAAADAVVPAGPQVKARLVSDVAGLAPGASFRLGVLFEISEGWHIYGKDPGDSGLPTTVQFELPAGFAASDVQYPTAQTFRAPGDIVTNGFEKEALLWVEAKAPARLPDSGAVTVKAKADWLSCKSICVPGSESVSLSLPVGPETTRPSAESRLFAQADKPKSDAAEAAQDDAAAMAPDFSLKDADGKTHSLADYRGKFVVLEWTNPQCPFVVDQYKTKKMQNTAAKYAAKGVVWLAVDSSNFVTAESAKSWAAQHDIAYPTLLDPAGVAGRAYGAKTTPHMFVINPDGKTVYQGAIDDNPLSKKAQTTNHVAAALDEALAGKAVPTAEAKPYGCSVKYAETGSKPAGKKKAGKEG